AHFPPGLRREIVLERAGFTTTDGESHLLSLGEFAAYYLLTWSPELWKQQGPWPEPTDMAAWNVPAEWRAAFESEGGGLAQLRTWFHAHEGKVPPEDRADLTAWYF